MLVTVIGYVVFWLALSFLLGLVLAVAVADTKEQRSDNDNSTGAAFMIGVLISLAITLLIVSGRIIF